MPILSTPGFDDPMGLLGACHRRVERFLNMLRLVSEQPPGPLGDEAREALVQALRYFDEAGPRHTADEEESLIPRLLAHGHPRIQALRPRIDALHADHRRAEALHAEVAALGRGWLNGPIDPAAHGRLAAAIAALGAIYTPHIAFEDEELFPLAERLLTVDERAAIGREMGARRGATISPV